jgi:hypothetical protein
MSSHTSVLLFGEPYTTSLPIGHFHFAKIGLYHVAATDVAEAVGDAKRGGVKGLSTTKLSLRRLIKRDSFLFSDWQHSFIPQRIDRIGSGGFDGLEADSEKSEEQRQGSSQYEYP